MKGKIDGNGRLQIERGGLLRTQECPFNPVNTWCGDHCPLFGEPKPGFTWKRSGQIDEDGKPVFEKIQDGKTNLQICNEREFEFDEFTDEREKEKTE